MRSGWAGALPCLVLSACATHHTTEFRAAPTALGVVSCVAVLPFEDLSQNPAAGDGFADAMATELMKTGRFQVMDRAESGRILATRGIYLTSTVDSTMARELGDVLGVQAVLVGAVNSYGYRSAARPDRGPRPEVGVSTRLIDVKTGDNLWGASFSGSALPFFAESRPPIYLAAQAAAADLASGLALDAGDHPAASGGPPCWHAKAQSVLATLAAPTSSRAPFLASGGPIPTPPPVVNPTPTPALAVLAVANPTPTESTPLGTPVPEATAEPVATPPPIVLTASQKTLLEKMAKPDAHFELEGVAFAGLTANLAESSSKVLEDLASLLKTHPEVRLRLESHVDPTDPGPVPLSQKRAETVVARLISLGVPPGEVEPKGMGGSKSRFPSFVEKMKEKNRRIELGVTSPPVIVPGTLAPAAQKPEVPARVKVLAAKGTSPAAVKLANRLKQGGTKVTAVASVPEKRTSTLVYFSPSFKEQAQKIARTISVPGGPRMSPSNSLGAGVDIVILVGADLK